MSLPKTVMLFAYENHYPSGGTEDLYSVYHTVEEAKQAVEESPNDLQDYSMLCIWNFADPLVEYYRTPHTQSGWTTQKSDYAKALERKGFSL